MSVVKPTSLLQIESCGEGSCQERYCLRANFLWRGKRDTVSESKCPFTVPKKQEYQRVLTEAQQAVVYEGMRMRPGNVGAFPKVVPPEGEVVQGKFIPGGTIIAMNVPYMLRSPELFGPDTGLFRPERWMEVSEDEQADMERQVEMMFGSGRWICAGKPIAFMELFKTFFEVSHDPLHPSVRKRRFYLPGC